MAPLEEEVLARPESFPAWQVQNVRGAVGDAALLLRGACFPSGICLFMSVPCGWAKHKLLVRYWDNSDVIVSDWSRSGEEQGRPLRRRDLERPTADPRPWRASSLPLALFGMPMICGI
jgi:hypothetical protein